ncbi:TPA: hypothetical protein ACWL8Y_004739 [Klebsiella pneumoniae]
MKHFHEILHDELQGFEVFKYTDVCFTFSGDETRQITFRLVFCAEDQPENSTLNQLFGAELATLSISVVSFYNIEAESNEACDSMFEKPPGAPNLNASEMQYLYRTLIDIILRISETERIQVLTFEAYSAELNRVYNRLVRKYAQDKNLIVHIEGACYVIRTSN